MSRAAVPASPADDLRAAREHAAASGAPLLTPELVDFLQSGISVILAAQGRDRRPIAGVALGCRIGDGEIVRVLLRRDANLPLLEAVETGGEIAVTFSRPVDHRSLQLKASRARTSAARPEDVPEAARQAEGLRKELIVVGYTPEFSAGYVAHAPEELVAIEFTPEQAFVQTPGPGAGSALSR